MIHFIFDWPCKRGSVCSDMFINEFYTKRHIKCDVDGSRRGKYRKIYWVLLAIRTILKSKRNDIIVCWLDFHGVLCLLFSRILFMKRRILAINILLKKKDTFSNKINRLLYRYAFSDKNFYFTYTSKYMDYANMKRSYLLQDTYVDRNNLFMEYSDCGKNVFVGGNNGRDWNLAYKVAAAMPDVNFYFIMPNIEKNKNYPHLQNVEEHYSIPYNEYLKYVSSCSVVFLPLKTEAPAGLIVLYEAAMKCKALIMTDTQVSRDYLSNTETGILIKSGDVDDAVKSIRRILNDKEFQKNISIKLQQKIMNLGKFENYCEVLHSIILDINKSKNLY